MKSGRALLKYSIAALCASTLVGCGSAPVTDTEPETASVAAIPESAPLQPSEPTPEAEPSITRTTTINSSNTASVVRDNRSEVLRQQRIAELEAKRMEYHQRWESEQQRKQLAAQAA